MRDRILVLIADDQRVVRDGLTLLLGLLPGVQVGRCRPGRGRGRRGGPAT